MSLKIEIITNCSENRHLIQNLSKVTRARKGYVMSQIILAY